MTTKPSKALTIASCPVISNDEVMPGAHLVWLESPRIAAGARPGQFVMVPCGEETYLPRPLSVHQVNGEKLALLFNIAGRGTKWLSQRKAGDTIDIFGPLGNGYIIQPDSKKLLLVAGGIGIAPLRFLEDSAIGQGYSVKRLEGAATASQLYKVKPAAATQFSSAGTVEAAATTEDGSEGTKGLVTDLIADHAPWADQVFACGPLPMYRTMAQMPELRNKPVQVSLEIVMGCGVGVCYGCTIRTKSGLRQVCQDGPVFDLADIIWEEIKSV